MTDEHKRFYTNNGFVIFENALTDERIQLLRGRAYQLAEEISCGLWETVTPLEKHGWDREEIAQMAHKLCCFWEWTDAPQIHKRRLIKLSFSLHKLDRVFQEIAQVPFIEEIAKDIGLIEPQIIQSMLHYKPPQSKTGVQWHQDASYIYTTPSSVVTFWFALEDATLDNGCLQLLPGYHQKGLKNRIIHAEDGTLQIISFDQISSWPLEESLSLPVKAGSLVIMHGHLPHASSDNISSQSRLALTLHIIDKTADFCSKNWIPNS